MHVRERRLNVPGAVAAVIQDPDRFPVGRDSEAENKCWRIYAEAWGIPISVPFQASPSLLDMFLHSQNLAKNMSADPDKQQLLPDKQRLHES